MLPAIPVAKLHDKSVPRSRKPRGKVDATTSLEYLTKGFDGRLLKILSNHIKPRNEKEKEKDTFLPLEDVRKNVMQVEKAKTGYRGIYQEAANEWNKDLRRAGESSTSVESLQIQRVLTSGGYNVSTI
ncbi:hypothetical protein DFQ30_007759 [Apophysomyces sp. BC1015]|nr:hypothetical protein DFQ30_007759 [Apophysomyces sp. BC1015]